MNPDRKGNAMVYNYIWSIKNILKNKEDNIIIHYNHLINDYVQ